MKPFRRFLRIGMILTICAIIWLIAITVSAQENEPVRPIYTMQDNKIVRWDFDTLQSISVISLGNHFVGVNAAQANAQKIAGIRSIALDTSEQFAFRIDITGSNDPQRIIYTRLVRADLKTGEETVLMDHLGIIQFSVSPSGDKVFVLYYEAGAERSRLVPCLLSIASGPCQELALRATPTGYPQWLDNQILVTLSITSNRKITLIDTSTLKVTVLDTSDNFDIVSFASIPNTHRFILGINRYDAAAGTPIEFYSLDRDTKKLSLLSLSTIFDPHMIAGTTVTAWLFSPDGRYLLYGNLGIDTKVALIEFKTGRVIGQWDHVTQATWLDNERLIFLEGGRLFIPDNKEPVPLFQFNVSTGEQTTLIEDASRIVILN